MNMIFLGVTLVGVIALIVAVFIARWINKNDQGSQHMREIASYIHQGAMTFLMREYRTIGIFAVVMFLVLFFAVNWQTATLFLLGASFSRGFGTWCCPFPFRC